MSASGSFDLFRSELVVGIALIVMRWYDGSAFRVSLCENDACIVRVGQPHSR